MIDTLIINARLIDGTGSPWYWGDIAIHEDRIAAMGALKGTAAGRVIDAAGRVVSPGFMDMHTHSDLQPLAFPTHDCKIRQGVTTDVIGHDGLGLAPVTPETAAILREQIAGWNGTPDVDWNWTTISSYLDRFDRQVAVNVAMFAPHGTIRLAVMGMENRPPAATELEHMKRLLDQAMREGAIGLSTGLTYAPCMFASDDELVELCEVMRPYGGFYAPHHRNYGMAALQAYADSIEIGRKAGVPVHLTHAHLGFPINKGRGVELLAMIDQARAEGVEVTLDTYPYLAGATTLHSLLPGWSHDGGTNATLARLQSPETRERLRHELEVTGSDGFQGVPLGWEMIQISGILGEHDPSVIGLTIDQAAARAGQTPFDYFANLLTQTRLGVSILSLIGNEENVQTIMQHPAHVIGSDGILIGGRPHPRGWGSHIRFLSHYVRDLGLLTWEEGIRKITSAAARRIGSIDRGILRPGFMADLVIFDPDTLRDTATYEQPRSYPKGVDYVAVNGSFVVAEGQTTGALPGRALRRPFGRTPERFTRLL
ncbi:MAG: D-aminoacylase [Anaerolineae bacterium]|nr:D-aminoacylase [Anaerolineae bacterium]